MFRYLLLLPILLLLNCTGADKTKTKGKPLARVGKEYLYEHELQALLPPNFTKEDSLKMRTQLIDNWVREQVIYQRALKELTEEEKNKEQQLQDYYQSLILHEYRQKLLHSQFDTVISPEEIEQYYTENAKNFELKRNIIRLLYVKVPLDAPDAEKARFWIRKPSEENFQLLSDYCHAYAANCALDTNVWYYFDNITKEVPIIESYNPSHFLQRNRYVELRDSSYVYMMRLVERRLKEDISPLSLEQSRIKDILRNQRQVRFLKSREKQIYREGLTGQSIEIYGE